MLSAKTEGPCRGGRTTCPGPHSREASNTLIRYSRFHMHWTVSVMHDP